MEIFRDRQGEDCGRTNMLSTIASAKVSGGGAFGVILLLAVLLAAAVYSLWRVFRP